MTNLDRLIRCVKVVADNQIPEITEDTILSDLGIDSLGMLEVSILAEEKFGFEIDDDKLETVDTVGQMLKVIEAMMPKKH